MAFSKITYNGTTLMDVTQDTVAANKLLANITATDASGTGITGNIANGSGITFNGKTATAAAGYYASAATANMGLATVTSGTATISSVTYTYSSANGNFTVAGSANVSAPTVGTAGYISSSEGTKNAKTNGASVSTTVAKIGITATNSVPSGKSACVTPVISKNSLPSGVTDAATTDAATTTAPSSGVYVAVKSAADNTTLTATPSVSSAGYGTTTSGQYTATNATTTVGANASSVTYVKIKTATPAFDGGAISGSVTGITGSNVTLSDTDNGISVTGAASAGRAAVLYNGAVAGWVSKSDNAEALAATSSNVSLTSKTRYITAITVPKDKTFSLTSTADTALDNTSNITITNGAYRQIALTNSANADTNISNAGQVDITQSSSSTGAVTINAYSDAATPALTTAKTVVENGKWKYTTVTPDVSSTLGPYYGAVRVSAMSAGTKAVVTSGSATISSASYTYDSTNNNFTVTGSATVAAPSVDTAGYISSSAGTKNTNTATLSTTVAKIGISAAMTGTAKVTPVISKITTASGNSATNITAVVSAATTTKPTSGYYVAVQSAGATNNITATPSVSSAGYGTTTSGQYTAATSTLAVGANDSSVTYLPVTGASLTFAGGGLSTAFINSNNKVITTATTDDYHNGLTITTSRAAVTYTNTAGYIPAHTSAQTASDAPTNTVYYLKGVKIPTPSSGISCFDITVPNGNSTDFITFHFEVDSSSNVTVTDTHTT